MGEKENNKIYNKPLGYIDKERMNKALSDPMHLMPAGLTRKERREEMKRILAKTSDNPPNKR